MRLVLALTLAALAACATPVRPAIDFLPVPPTTPVPELVASLASPDAGARASAAWQLANVPTLPDEAVVALKQLRDDPERPVRYAATWALGFRPGGAAPAAEDAPRSTNPRLLRQAKPVYPEIAFLKRIEGTVVIHILIGEEGEVAHVQVRRSIPALDQAAVDCVRQWHFEPAREDGAARAVVAAAPVAFRRF